MEEQLPVILHRLRPFLDLQPGANVLDVGAAQGVTLTAFKRAGYRARGIEPWEPARAVGCELAARTNTEYNIVPGVAESLPFEDESFDYVNANSVLEHVDYPQRAFSEAFRVLRPGGVYKFGTTSALSPFQSEIAARFAFFPWYPARVQRAIMAWAAANHPWMVGSTMRPAIHWFRHRRVQRELREIGFKSVIDRWTVRALSRERTGWRQAAIALASRYRPVRLIGDLIVPGMEYVAVK
jgi:SAM-dependent methyltransferase